MVPENCVIELAECAAAHEAEIGDVVLVETGVGLPLFFTAAGHQADLAHEFLFRDAVPESRVAGAKYGSQYAVAGYRTFLDVRLLPHALARDAKRFRQPDGL